MSYPEYLEALIRTCELPSPEERFNARLALHEQYEEEKKYDQY